jgi:hypothetical protein
MHAAVPLAPRLTTAQLAISLLDQNLLEAIQIAAREIARN